MDFKLDSGGAMNRKKDLASIGACVLVGAFSTAALGQSSAGADSAPRLEEVVVTGSRLVVEGGSSPTPLTAITAEQMQLAAPSTIADALAQIPQFRGSQRPSSFVSAQGSAGAHLNLRALGSNRVLVLLDGRRTTPDTPQNEVDVNLFPNLLVKRVDIVTGGASAAYGSDAVAGVVNYVLDHEFTGIRAELNGGISSRSDNASRKAALAGGWRLMDDRLHLMASAEYFHSDGVETDKDRKWNHRHVGVIQNPTWPGDGRTRFLWRPGVTGTDLAYGGVISAGPLRGTQFADDGSPMPFAYGTEVTGATMVGGDGVWEPRGNVVAQLETKSAFVHAGLDLSDDWTLFAEGAYAETDTRFPFVYGSFSGSANFRIFDDNAFLSQTVLDSMAAANISNFTMGRISRDWGRSMASTPTKTYRGTLGLNGEIGEWAVDGYVDVGRTDASTSIKNLVIRSRVYEAADAVRDPVSGQIVCGSTLSHPGNGCSPLNVFGDGASSEAARAYVTGESWSRIELAQLAVGISTRGSPFENWAGEVQLGVGVDYRENTAEIIADPISMSIVQAAPGSKGLPPSQVGLIGGFQLGNTADLPKSTIDVAEAYVETVIPLLSGLPAAQELDLNAAVRFVDYSTTGSVVPWKLGLNYRPTDSLRFRATLSRDIRAPNAVELFSPPRSSGGTVNDPLTGQSNQVPGIARGNPDLDPEEASTYTVGVVWTPSFIEGLTASVDYYDIELEGAIGVLGQQTIVNLCHEGRTEYCAFVHRLPPPENTIIAVERPFINLNRINTKGVDFEAGYASSLDRMNSKWGGTLRARAIVNYIDTLATTDIFGGVIEAAGVNGGERNAGEAGAARWQGSLSLSVDFDKFGVFVQERFISDGIYRELYTTGNTGSNSIDSNSVAGRNYTDLTLRYMPELLDSGRTEFFLTVNNLFDRDPPDSPTRAGAPIGLIFGTQPTLYDVVGRYITAGVRVQL